MTTRLLEEARTFSDLPLQCIQKAPEKIAPGLIHSYYFECRFQMEQTIGRYRVVRQYDPEDWPYPPEPDCQKEWDEAEE